MANQPHTYVERKYFYFGIPSQNEVEGMFHSYGRFAAMDKLRRSYNKQLYEWRHAKLYEEQADGSRILIYEKIEGESKPRIVLPRQEEAPVSAKSEQVASEVRALLDRVASPSPSVPVEQSTRAQEPPPPPPPPQADAVRRGYIIKEA